MCVRISFAHHCTSPSWGGKNLPFTVAPCFSVRMPSWLTLLFPPPTFQPSLTNLYCNPIRFCIKCMADNFQKPGNPPRLQKEMHSPLTTFAIMIPHFCRFERFFLLPFFSRFLVQHSFNFLFGPLPSFIYFVVSLPSLTSVVTHHRPPVHLLAVLVLWHRSMRYATPRVYKETLLRSKNNAPEQHARKYNRNVASFLDSETIMGTLTNLAQFSLLLTFQVTKPHSTYAGFEKNKNKKFTPTYCTAV